MRKKKKITIFDIARILIGVILLYTSLTKAIDPLGATFETEHKTMIIGGQQELQRLSFIITFLFIVIEFVLGVSLIFGLFLRHAVLISVVLFTVYLPLSYIIAVRNPYYSGLSCNPFDLSNQYMFLRNLILWILSIILLFNKKKLKPSKLNERYQLSWVLTTTLGIIFFILINYSFLPIVDFTCFPKGTDLNAKVEKYFTDVKTYHKYKAKLLYYNKQTRKFKYFNEENIPWRDTNWVWINTKLIPQKQTVKGALSKFCIVNSLGRDITDSLLHIKEPVILIVSYDLNKINVSGFRKTLDYARVFRDQYFPVAYCLTASDQKAVDSIIELTGAYDIEFCFTDPQFLKSLIRANPGIIILKEGVIIKKRSYNLLPNLEKNNFYMINPK